MAISADPNAECLACGAEWWDDENGHPILDEENATTGEWCDGPMRAYAEGEGDG